MKNLISAAKNILLSKSFIRCLKQDAVVYFAIMGALFLILIAAMLLSVVKEFTLFPFLYAFIGFASSFFTGAVTTAILEEKHTPDLAPTHTNN